MSVTHALLSATSRSTSAWTRARALSLCRRYFGTSKRSSSTRCDLLDKKRISVYNISVSLYACYRSSDRLKSEPRTLEYLHIYIAQSVERIHNPVPILKGFLFRRLYDSTKVGKKTNCKMQLCNNKMQLQRGYETV